MNILLAQANAFVHTFSYQLSCEGPVAEKEGGGLGAPGLEVILGVLNEDICMLYVSKSL